MDVRDRSSRHRHRYVSQRCVAGSDRVRPNSRDRGGLESTRENVVQDRDVMWQKVPEHVGVGLYEAEVDANGVDVLDRPKSATMDLLTDARDGGRVAGGVVAHEAGKRVV